MIPGTAVPTNTSGFSIHVYVLIKTCSKEEALAPAKRQQHHTVQYERQPGITATQGARLEARGCSNLGGPLRKSGIALPYSCIIEIQPKIRSAREVTPGKATTHQVSTTRPIGRRQKNCAEAQGQWMLGTPPTSSPPRALVAAITLVVTVTHRRHLAIVGSSITV